MNWRREKWRKLYVREEGSFATLSFAARAVAGQLLKYVDEHGRIDDGGRDVADAIAFRAGATRGDRRIIRQALAELLRDGYLEPTVGGVQVRNFRAAQGLDADTTVQPSRTDGATTVSRQRNETRVKGAKSRGSPPVVERRSEETRQDQIGDCAETASPSSTPPVAIFPVDGDEAKTFSVTEALIAKLSKAFPSLDVSGEVAKALVWIEMAPDRRKTAKGMPKFLFNWMSRAQNRGPATNAHPARAGAATGASQRRDDPYCEAHSSHGKNLPATKPSFRPRPGCPGCQEYNARHRGRSGEPEQLGDLMPAWAQPNGGEGT